ncbi:hypothetical protein PUNSTDRAFT_140386 [Punctularia strigosozonata HHB-11173 SS5]|uniref:uncharacterized protein n=1 Tax=Punctularia strigosozonata (strain HHB-11173) TaxID=741275 RepID=UPI000441814B|nr:uncharacterized protein PUNSTDRAFT_140386 [Punctularia strigosozonata HHB-11173 SS5]EIN13979.1 hypothetical protein PUNSTDRAFT_140386 [Punctularia strigosozonata HHB-11173 SS5]
MASDIRERLLSAEQQLLNAVTSGGTSLLDFHVTWDALSVDVERAVESNSLDEQMRSIANSVTSRVSILVEHFLKLNSSSSSFQSSFLDTVEHILNSTDIIPNDKDESSSDFEPEICATMSYVEPAYQWLIANIHNPYPSTAEKIRLARKSGVTVEVISDWFSRARRRMGWTNICATYFNNCKSDMIDAARRAYVDDLEQPHKPLPQELAMVFVQLRSRALELYSGKYRASELVKRLQPVVQSVDKVGHRTSRRRRKGKNSICTLSSGILPENPAASYPSPPSSSPADQSTTESEDISQCGQKRRRLSPPSGPPAKRHRSVDVTADPAHPLQLPSPLASPKVTAEDVPATQMRRKRRLSTSASEGLPKRPRGAPKTSRLQVVSDPFPAHSADVHNEDPSYDLFGGFFTSKFSNIHVVPEITTPMDGADHNVDVGWLPSNGSSHPSPPLVSLLAPLSHLELPDGEFFHNANPAIFDPSQSLFGAGYNDYSTLSGNQDAFNFDPLPNYKDFSVDVSRLSYPSSHQNATYSNLLDLSPSSEQVLSIASCLSSGPVREQNQSFLALLAEPDSGTSAACLPLTDLEAMEAPSSVSADTIPIDAAGCDFASHDIDFGTMLNPTSPDADDLSLGIPGERAVQFM